MKMLSKMLTSYIDKNHRTVPTFANRSQFTSGLRSVQQKVKSEFYKYTPTFSPSRVEEELPYKQTTNLLM